VDNFNFSIFFYGTPHNRARTKSFNSKSIKLARAVDVIDLIANFLSFSLTSPCNEVVDYHRNTPESLGKMLWNIDYSPAVRVPTAFIVLPESTRTALTR